MGGVVPPRNPKTRKTPDQAARISQSVDFAHLSDILAFLGYFRKVTKNDKNDEIVKWELW